jgi:hypothetical protein
MDEQITDYYGAKKSLSKMSFDDKKKLLDLLFVDAQVDREEKAPGIYLERMPWGTKYRILGLMLWGEAFWQEEGAIDMTIRNTHRS